MLPVTQNLCRLSTSSGSRYSMYNTMIVGVRSTMSDSGNMSGNTTNITVPYQVGSRQS